MRLTRQEGGRLARLVRVIALGALTALVLLALYLTPDLLRILLPWWTIRGAIEWTAVAFLAGYSVAWRLTKSRHGSVPWIARLAWALHLGNAVSGKLLQRWLVVGFAGLSTLCLLAWIPHYLYWPWCRDPDGIALMAQEWDSGVLPYRDIRSFNFPGHIYLHWILGKLFGWGHTGLFYALDATALLFLGAVVIAWSRRRLGHSLPGTAAYLIFLAYYLDISFLNVAQRDWHAPLCTTLGLLVLEAWPGRRTRWLSALLAAIGLTIRPNIVLFLPALLVAVTSCDVTTRGRLPADKQLGSLPGEQSCRPWNGSGAFAIFAAIGLALRCCSADCWTISFGDSQS